MNNSTSSPVRILNRHEPCKCGCLGKDAWHAKSFKRVVTDIQNLQAPSEVYKVISVKTGVAKFPWGKSKVHQLGALESNGNLVLLGWRITK